MLGLKDSMKLFFRWLNLLSSAIKFSIADKLERLNTQRASLKVDISFTPCPKPMFYDGWNSEGAS